MSITDLVTASGATRKVVLEHVKRLSDVQLATTDVNGHCYVGSGDLAAAAITLGSSGIGEVQSKEFDRQREDFDELQYRRGRGYQKRSNSLYA